MAKTVGLYLGVSSLGVAVVSGREVMTLSNFNISELGEAKAEIVDKDVRLEALINKALRDANADGADICLSLADRDFIFRSLEMPLMRKAEIESSLAYEVEKYIPFKIGELEWAYETTRFPKDKKMSVSFIGIREGNLQRVREILNRLGARAVSIEPSSLSLVRALKSLKKFSKLRDFALLNLTEAESHLTFFQNDLPVFNRYLTIPKKEDVFDTVKFSESVDFSYQYFKREFRSYKIDKFVVVSDIESKELTKVLEESLQVAVEATSPFDITRRNNASVESSKAFGAAVADQYPAAFRPRFQKTKDSQELEVAEVVTEIPPLRLGVMSLILGAGLAIALFIAVIMGNEVSLKEVELRKKRDAVFVPQGLESLPWSQHKKAVDDLESELNKLKSALDSFNNLSGVFTSLSSRRTLPDGLWLENFQLNRQDKGYQAKISGYVFRDDDYKERLTLDDFVTKLKNDSSLQALFSTVEIESSRRQPQKEFLVTYFSINLK